jgi:hypothetical protein
MPECTDSSGGFDMLVFILEQLQVRSDRQDIASYPGPALRCLKLCRKIRSHGVAASKRRCRAEADASLSPKTVESLTEVKEQQRGATFNSSQA